MKNTAGSYMSGMFYLDWGSIAAGEYEYQYTAFDNTHSIGKFINQQRGTFNTTNPAAPTASAQQAIPMGGIGRSLIDQWGLRLLNQGSDVATVNMRYRVANTTRTAGDDSHASFEINCIHGFPFSNAIMCCHNSVMKFVYEFAERSVAP